MAAQNDVTALVCSRRTAAWPRRSRPPRPRASRCSLLARTHPAVAATDVRVHGGALPGSLLGPQDRARLADRARGPPEGQVAARHLGFGRIAAS